MVGRKNVVPAVPVKGEEGEGLREIVTPAFIQERYSVSEQFIARRISEGHLRPFKVGAKANRFYLDEVIAFMEANQQKRKVG